MRLNGTLDALADRLDPETGRDERRARALGLLADPHSASRLLSDAPPDEPEQVAPTTQVIPETTVNLVVHLRPTDLIGTGNHVSGGVWEKHGPQTRAALTELLGEPGHHDGAGPAGDRPERTDRCDHLPAHGAARSRGSAS